MSSPHIHKITKYALLFLFCSLLFLSVASAYYRYIVLEDYEIYIEFDETGAPINVDEE